MSGPPPMSYSFIGGPWLVGLALNWGLVGVLTVQVFIYHTVFPNDRLGLKAIVYSVYIIDLIQTFMNTQQVFKNLIYDFGSPSSFRAFSISWLSLTVLGGLVSYIAQTTYAWRIWVFSKSKVVSGLVAFLSLLQFASSFAAAVELMGATHVGRIPNNVLAAALLWLVSSALVDVIIAVSMIYLLSRMRMRSRNFDLINRLIVFSLESGAITATVSVLVIIAFMVWPTTLIHVCPLMVLPKLYSNSLLAGFNNRALMQQKGMFRRDTVTDDAETGGSVSGFEVAMNPAAVATMTSLDSRPPDYSTSMEQSQTMAPTSVSDYRMSKVAPIVGSPTTVHAL
ncbi:hypothetical protein ABKN59_002994 [Abortiporus biennis]